MKNIAITCFVLIAVCVGLQAKKVVKAPYFMATNTSQIEFEKVTLGKDTTWIDAKIYSIPGEDVRIDSTAVLQIGGKTYAYLGGNGFSKELWTKTPASGELAVTLKFEPILWIRKVLTFSKCLRRKTKDGIFMECVWTEKSRK